jgi:hypothetical protein
MGFSFSKIFDSPKKLLGSSINLAKNPFDKDAHKQFFKDGADPFSMANRGAGGKRQDAGQYGMPQQQYQPQIYQAPPQYQSFADLFNQPQFDQSQVTDIYQRGNMPNNLLDRYNSLMTNLQAQQAAMVPRTPPPTVANGQTPAPPMTRVDPRQGNPYINFAQMFGAR